MGENALRKLIENKEAHIRELTVLLRRVLNCGSVYTQLEDDIERALAGEGDEREWRCDFCGALKGMCPGHGVGEGDERG